MTTETYYVATNDRAAMGVVMEPGDDCPADGIRHDHPHATYEEALGALMAWEDRTRTARLGGATIRRSI